MIESGEDDSYNTVSIASNYKEKFVNIIDTFECNDISVEVYLEETDQGYYVNYDIYYYDKIDITYYLSFTISEGECIDLYLNAWGDMEIDDEFSLPKLDDFS